MADKPVMMMLESNIVVADVMKSFLLPNLSTEKAAPTAKIRFQIWGQTEIRVCWVTLFIPIVSRTRAW